MESVEIRLPVAAEPEAVINAFWRLEEWPSVARHVRRIEMHYGDERVQVLTFHVETRGRLDAFQSVRFRQGNTIYFFQPSPPPILNRHHGSWRIKPSENGALIISSHALDINVKAAATFLKLPREAGAYTIRRGIRQIIRNNSLQTMGALKARLESKEEHNASRAVK